MPHPACWVLFLLRSMYIVPQSNGDGGYIPFRSSCRCLVRLLCPPLTPSHLHVSVGASLWDSTQAHNGLEYLLMTQERQAARHKYLESNTDIYFGRIFVTDQLPERARYTLYNGHSTSNRNHRSKHNTTDVAANLLSGAVPEPHNAYAFSCKKGGASRASFKGNKLKNQESITTRTLQMQ